MTAGMAPIMANRSNHSAGTLTTIDGLTEDDRFLTVRERTAWAPGSGGSRNRSSAATTSGATDVEAAVVLLTKGVAPVGGCGIVTTSDRGVGLTRARRRPATPVGGTT